MKAVKNIVLGSLAILGFIFVVIIIGMISTNVYNAFSDLIMLFLIGLATILFVLLIILFSIVTFGFVASLISDNDCETRQHCDDKASDSSTSSLAVNTATNVSLMNANTCVLNCIR